MVVTLDAPGIQILNTKEEKNYEKDRIVNYFLVPNVINTCNQHVGKMFQIKSHLKYKNEDIEINYNSESINVLEQELFKTINSHNLDLFKDFTKNYAEIQQVFEWPIATNKTGNNWSHSRKRFIR